MRTKMYLSAIVVYLVLMTMTALADVPRIISYQGRLKNTAGVPYNGDKLTKFIIYNGAGVDIWNTGFISVHYDSGLCAVKLGESPQPALPTGNWTSDTGLTLGITVDIDPEISPRSRFTTVGYAMHAKNSESTPWTGVTGKPAGFADDVDDNTTYTAGSGLTLGGGAFSIMAGGVNSGHLTDLGVATADIASDAITEPKIAASAVTTSEILDGAIMNLDVNAAANIDATKINGTAATLSANNVFIGSANVFQNGLEVGPSDDLQVTDTDLSLRRSGQHRWRFREEATTGLKLDQVYNDAGVLQNATRLEIGDNGNIGIQTTPSATNKVILQPPDLASVSTHYGLNVNMTNSSTGQIYGTQTRAYAFTASSGGTVWGLLSEGRSDGAPRYGIQSIAQGHTFSPAIGGSSYGVYGIAYDGAVAYGVYGVGSSATTNYGGYFLGNLNCTGTLSKGAGAFRIDHPLDPENKILQHSFVESPDMMNIYNGIVTTDNAGLARVILPEYFEALNKDFRYQLTVVGQFAQAIVAEEISGNQFTIRTDKPNVKVSWQVTGIRHDKFAEANRIQVELDKLPDQKGLYLHADAYGLSIDKSVDRENLKEAEKHRVENTAQKQE